MNSRRVEIILIIAFLFLDLFLGSVLYDRYNASTNGSNNSSIEITEEMEASGITYPEFEEIEHELPYVQADSNTLLQDNMTPLTEQSGNFNSDGTLYVSILSNPIELSEGTELNESDIQTIRDFLDSENVLYGESYEYLDYFPSTQQVRYAQTINGIPITDGTSSITFYFDSQWNIISYEQTYIGEVSAQGDAEKLITDKQAVETLFQNNNIPDNATVSMPKLSYYRTLNLDDVNLYVPSWYIKITVDNSPTIYHVSAIDGTVLTQSRSSEESDGEETESEESEETSIETNNQANQTNANINY